MGAERSDAGPLCNLLDWDTRFFGFRIGRSIPYSLSMGIMDSVSEWCQRESIRCLYFLCSAIDDVSSRVAERAGFQLVDVRFDFSKKIRHEGETLSSPPGLTLREWLAADIPTLESISETAFGGTRFWHDQNFPRDRVAALYRHWIVNSCRGFADVVLVAEYEGEPVGFITCIFDTSDAGRIGLVGIRSD